MNTQRLLSASAACLALIASSPVVALTAPAQTAPAGSAITRNLNAMPPTAAPAVVTPPPAAAPSPVAAPTPASPPRDPIAEALAAPRSVPAPVPTPAPTPAPARAPAPASAPTASVPRTPVSDPAFAPEPVPNAAPRPAPAAVQPLPTSVSARPSAAPAASTAPRPAPSTSPGSAASGPPATPVPAPTEPVEPPPPAPTVLDAAAVAALPFTAQLPAGFSITTGRPGPDFRVYTIRRGDQPFVMVYAGPSSQFPIYSGERVEAGGRSSVVLTDGGVRHPLEHLFQRTAAPREVHIWVASLEGADQTAAETIAQNIDVR